MYGIGKQHEGVVAAGLDNAILRRGWIELMRATYKWQLTAYLPLSGKVGSILLGASNLWTYRVLRGSDAEGDAEGAAVAASKKIAQEGEGKGKGGA